MKNFKNVRLVFFTFTLVTIISLLPIISALGYVSPSPFPSSTNKQTVILVIDKDYYDDAMVKLKIDRYKTDYADYNFKDIIYKKNNTPVSDPLSQGGNIKGNSLEVRNTIKSFYSTNRTIIGVWVIGNIRPTIWRDANLWRDLGASGFYPSVFPYVAIDQEYYSDFNVENDGFYEKAGMTKGSEVGGGYNATIWGAVLIPPTKDLTVGKNLVKQFFDKDHNYRIDTLKFSNKLIYSDAFGCSTKRITDLKNNKNWQTTFLCPNNNDQLQGFSSTYNVSIYNKATNGTVYPTTDIEISEFSNWVNQSLFNDSLWQKAGPVWDTNVYALYLILKGRSMDIESIKKVVTNNLPTQICSRIDCGVRVSEIGYRESDLSWDGRWFSYPQQQSNWATLYDQLLKSNDAQITYISTHGSPTSHNFNIDANKVKNANYSSLIYEIEACNTSNYLVDDYISGNYLFYGNTLAVSGYSIPYLLQGENGYNEAQFSYTARFMNINSGLVIDQLFLKNYENSIYLGDPLLKLQSTSTPPVPVPLTVTVKPTSVSSGQPVTLNFSYPSNIVSRKLYLSCPAGVSAIWSRNIDVQLCNKWLTLDSTVGKSMTFPIINTSKKAQNAVPNFYVSYPSNPNYLNGVSANIEIRPAITPKNKETREFMTSSIWNAIREYFNNLNAK